MTDLRILARGGFLATELPGLATPGRVARAMRDRGADPSAKHSVGNEWRVARARGRRKPRVPQIAPARRGSVGIRQAVCTRTH